MDKKDKGAVKRKRYITLLWALPLGFLILALVLPAGVLLQYKLRMDAFERRCRFYTDDDVPDLRDRGRCYQVHLNGICTPENLAKSSPLADRCRAQEVIHIEPSIDMAAIYHLLEGENAPLPTCIIGVTTEESVAFTYWNWPDGIWK